MLNIEDFYKALLEIEDKLQALEHCSDMAKLYEGNDFADQNLYAADLENKIIAVTHETASQIGFARHDIAKFVKYLEFRIKYKMFSDIELQGIIDTELTSLDKLALAKQILNGDSKLLMNLIHETKEEWNKSFENKKYTDVARLRRD